MKNTILLNWLKSLPLIVLIMLTVGLIACQGDEDGIGDVGVTSVTISPSGSLSVIAGDELQFSGEIAPADASVKTILWSVSNESLATISATGLLTTITAGTVEVTATTQSGNKEDTETVIITEAIVSAQALSVFPESMGEEEGAHILEGRTSSEAFQVSILPAATTDKSVTWSSANDRIATIDQNGFVTGVAKGATKIFATSNDDESLVDEAVVVISELVPMTSISLNAPPSFTFEGLTFQLVATTTPNNATFANDLEWSSEDENVAIVDENGLVTAMNQGATKIWVEGIQDDVSTNVVFNVMTKVPVESVIINENELSVEEGMTGQLTATINPSNASNKGVSWSSDNESIATVDQNGLVTAVSPGTANITVTSDETEGGVKSATLEVTVTEMAVTEIELLATVNIDGSFESGNFDNWSQVTFQEIAAPPAVSKGANVGDLGNNVAKFTPGNKRVRLDNTFAEDNFNYSADKTYTFSFDYYIASTNKDIAIQLKLGKTTGSGTLDGGSVGGATSGWVHYEVTGLDPGSKADFNGLGWISLNVNKVTAEFYIDNIKIVEE